jgi:thiol-disulfide isomerase/thioredoxin
MKKVLFLSLFFLPALATFSQSVTPADSTPEYIKTGVIPAFTTYKSPDSTSYTLDDVPKGKPILMMLFSPDCGHCQHVTTEILDNISHFKKDRILMFTWLPYSDMAKFYKDYKIANYPEITMAWDSKFFFVPYYHVHMYPKLIIYDKKGHYVKEFDGNINIDDVWKALNNG